uniref:Uncharacterized protein n=1 Tax=Anguilla anguilla TaxID=7936 RepID=A0A0E9S2P6_ANGAN
MVNLHGAQLCFSPRERTPFSFSTHPIV